MNFDSLPAWVTLNNVATFLASGLVTYLVIRHYWAEIRLRWTYNTWKMPFFGRLKKLVNKHDHRPNKAGWTNAERELGAAMQSHMQQYGSFDPEYFQRAKDYLLRAGDASHKPMSLLMWGVLVIILIAEAYGFGWVLAQIIGEDMDKTARTFMLFSASSLLSIVFAGLTHWAGTEWHRANVAKEVYNEWMNDSDLEKPSSCRRLYRVDFRISDPDSTNHNDRDAGSPSYVQMLNRLKLSPSEADKKTARITLIIATIVMATLITGVRFYFADQSALRARIANEMILDANAVGQGPTVRSDVPADLDAKNNGSLSDAMNQELDAKMKANALTFIALAIVFVIIQLIATLMSQHHTFNGELSLFAYRVTHRFNTRDEYENFFNEKRRYIVQIAQELMAELQSRALDKAEKSRNYSIEDLEVLQNRSEYSFESYLALRDEEELLAQEKKEETRRKASRRKVDREKQDDSPATPPESKVDEAKSSGRQIRTSRAKGT